MDNHLFWQTQPIDINKNNIINEAISVINVNDVCKEPYLLPENYTWCTLNINDDNDLNLIYKFLLDYYNSSKNASKKYHYQKDFLRWFLKPYEYYDDLLVGVKYNNKLVATIFGIPMNIKVYDKNIKMVEINFLCVHESLRNKRLAPVLIKEITRRTNLHGIFQAFYTASHDLPNSLMKCSYYHRPLNIPKLVDIKFIEKPDKISLQGFAKLFKTLDNTTINIRKIKPDDYNICCKLLNEYNNKFKISIIFSQEEFNNHFAFKENIIESFVVENNYNITDFISFVFIPSKLNNNTNHTNLSKAYVYYYFNTETDLCTLVDNGLYLMKTKNIDVVNAMKQYNNEEFLDKLKFKEGVGELNFYLYNWSCPSINYNDMAVIMV
jgi:glycylpeptide N-tetradecanoyltransferase